jgi:hypothetical protein
MNIIHNNHDALIIGDLLPALWRNHFERNRVSCTVYATVLARIAGRIGFPFLSI